MKNKKSINILEVKIAGINSNIFFKEFTFSKNKFKPNPSSEYELADNIIWMDDLLIVMQLKERKENLSKNNEEQNKWFKNKVLKKGIKQIKNTLNYLNNYENIEIINERNHKFNITPKSISNIFKLIVFSSEESTGYCKYHESSTADFIHILHIKDYIDICLTLVTSIEITEYLIFREKLLKIWSGKKINHLSEKCLIGQYFSEEFELFPDKKYLEYYEKFLNNTNDFAGFFHVLGDFYDYMIYCQNQNHYYNVLIEFMKLNRNRLIEINERFELCLEASKNNKLEFPYRIVSVESQCGFVLVPITKELFPHRKDGLYNFTIAHKYECKLSSCVGISFAYNDGEYIIDWIIIEREWKYDPEIEKLLSENNPFRKLIAGEKPLYNFKHNNNSNGNKNN